MTSRDRHRPRLQHRRQRLVQHHPVRWFNSINNILPEVPAQNIIAMFKAVQEFNGRDSNF